MEADVVGLIGGIGVEGGADAAGAGVVGVDAGVGATAPHLVVGMGGSVGGTRSE